MDGRILRLAFLSRLGGVDLKSTDEYKLYKLKVSRRADVALCQRLSLPFLLLILLRKSSGG